MIAVVVICEHRRPISLSPAEPVEREREERGERGVRDQPLIRLKISTANKERGGSSVRRNGKRRSTDGRTAACMSYRNMSLNGLGTIEEGGIPKQFLVCTSGLIHASQAEQHPRLNDDACRLAAGVL